MFVLSYTLIAAIKHKALFVKDSGSWAQDSLTNMYDRRQGVGRNSRNILLMHDFGFTVDLE